MILTFRLHVMKHLYKLGLFAAGLALTTSCEHPPLAFDVARPVSFERQEQIDAYQDLKTYISKEANPGFKLGAGVLVSDYNQSGVLYRLINRNFDEISPGTALKHGSVVKADGSLNLENVNTLFTNAEKGKVSIFGQGLVSHANQNAAYLNGLLAPLIVESPAFANSLNTSSLQAGTLNGYAVSGAGANVSVVENEGMGGSAKAIKLKSGSSASAPGDLKLVTPSIPVVPGHEYEVVFYIKSDAAGEGRVAFEGLKNNTPQKDWMNTGKSSEKFATGPGWKRVRFRISDFEGSSIKLHFDLGYAPNLTYYLDIQNLYVYDTQGEPLVSNLVANGDFESGSGWGGWGNNSTRGITAAGMGLNNAGKAFYVTNPSKTSGYWAVQTSYELPKPLDNGKAYKLSFWVKGSEAGVIRPELQSPNYSSNGFGTVNVSTAWQLITLTTTATAADRSRLVFSYGEFSGTVYIDNVVLSTAVAVGGTTIVPKNALEKQAIIAGELERWISGMVTHAAPKLNAWEVLTEPMDNANPAEVRSGLGRTLAADEFYWQDYLGKDYGVKAFQLARKYAKDNDLLFINDSNLEQNLDKCRGLIAYVNYLESKGAEVDGIGTQMNISLDTDKQAIATMFQLLAATGKKIRISGLNVAVGGTTDQATTEQYQAQQHMYQYAVGKYLELVPASQRYGITVIPLDSPANAAWRAKEPIGLWTEGFNRKPAYSGFAEGLKALK